MVTVFIGGQQAVGLAEETANLQVTDEQIS